jgi:thymidylate synthase (FAD)
MARVSNPDNAGNQETAPRLLRYLIEHRHWSPFEMAGLCLCIETERDISAQILRHRSFSFQEFSQRYAEATAAHAPHFRRQDEKNRQNSTDDLHEGLQQWATEHTEVLISKAFNLYYEFLQAGVAKECARRVLPMCTPTTLYMHGTLRSWIHYIQLRTEVGTQAEHRWIAEACQEIFTQQFPTIAAAAFAP